MGADRARRSFDPGRMYRSVVSQQGRVTVEADANEAEEIKAAELRAELLEIVGPTGTPDAGFKITAPLKTGGMAAFDLGIAAGTLYIGGVRVSQPAATTYLSQKDAEWHDFPAGAVPAASPGTTVPFDELVYLVVTEHEVSAVEDRALREVALGGPDTAARTRLVQRVMRAPSPTGDCEEALASVLGKVQGVGFDPSTMRVTSTGELKVAFVAAAAQADPCEPSAQAGFLGPDNQLIRLQVSGDRSVLWGYDNASFLFRGKLTPDRQSIKLFDTPVDLDHRLRAGRQVEVLDVAVHLDADERVAASFGMPYVLDGYTESTNTIHLPTPALQSLGAEVFVRVWENTVTFSANPAAAAQLVFRDGTSTGIEIYTTGARVPGDYWMVGVRPSTPDAILPARLSAKFQPPDGPNRWAAALARIHWVKDDVAQVHDCRRPFDDLVTLTRSEACGLTLHPGDDLQRLIDRRLTANAALNISSLHLKFSDGRFDLTAPLEVTARQTGGYLKITGCGYASEVLARGPESAIVTSGWVTTTVSDLTIATQRTAVDAVSPHIDGALTILDTEVAAVERVHARCAGGPTRSASCVTIRNTRVFAGTLADVRSCVLNVGANQVGVLLVNTALATVEHNRVVWQSGPEFPITITRRTVIGNVRVGGNWSTEPTTYPNRTSGSFPLSGEHSLAFTTDVLLKDLWMKALAANKAKLWPEAHDGPVTAEDRQRIRAFIRRAVTQILNLNDKGNDPLSADQVAAFRLKLDERRRAPRRSAAAPAQGIVVAGAIATDVRILHNWIAPSMQAIHVGLSKRGARDARVRAQRVQIIGNTIEHRVPAERSPTHAGIFVGNVAEATIRDNRIRCEFDPSDERPQVTRAAEGIRVWGVLGDARGDVFLSISGNISRAESIGTRFVQVGATSGDSLVQITQNLAARTPIGILSPGGYEVAIDNRP